MRRAVVYHLEDCRRAELEALATGFRAISIHAHLKLFNASELMNIVFGQQVSAFVVLSNNQCERFG